MARSAAREAAMQLVFEQLFGGEGKASTLVDMTDFKPSENDINYINKVTTGVSANAASIDAEITSCLRGWTIERISKVDLAVLRLAIYEMHWMEDIPNAVSIDQAVEMTRKFSSEESCKFVNGVLGTINRKLAGKSENSIGN